MRILIAPQSLKGSLTAAEAGSAIAQGVRAIFPKAEIDFVPIADGGEGTVQALVDASGGKIIQMTVTGPLGEPVPAFFGLMGDGNTAVIEMAACAGLPLVPPEKRDPRITTTYGVGELIRAALDNGSRHFIIGIGGSATNDGGAGLVQALGAKLFDLQSREISRGGAALATLAHISTTGLDPRLQQCTVDVACDVNNPLCGPMGASAVYGPQKGATPEMVEELDKALAHYAQIIEKELGLSIQNIPGAGAAGGLGAGLMAFLHAKLRPGAQIIFEALSLEKHIQQADLVITAEGQIDAQTAYGKSVGAVAEIAKRYNLPVLAFAGSLGENYKVAFSLGVDAIEAIPDRPMTLTFAMENAALLIRDSAERACRLIRIGMISKDLQEYEV
ncbi:MAG TPA: glycerate kinase [Ktedonobacteraceae bacterium]|nr:glycerate kinase [Ktedonobacteraceae bacterium]